MDFTYQPVERYRAILALLFLTGDKAKQENQDDNASAKSGEDGTKGIKFGLKKTDDQPASVKQSNVLEEGKRNAEKIFQKEKI